MADGHMFLVDGSMLRYPVTGKLPVAFSGNADAVLHIDGKWYTCAEYTFPKREFDWEMMELEAVHKMYRTRVLINP